MIKRYKRVCSLEVDFNNVLNYNIKKGKGGKFYDRIK